MIYNLSANHIFKIYKNGIGLHCITEHCHHSRFHSNRLPCCISHYHSFHWDKVQYKKFLVSHTCNVLNHILSCIRSGVVPTFHLAQVTECSWQYRHSTATHTRIPVEHHALLLSLPSIRGICIEPWICADIKLQMLEVVAPCSCLDIATICPTWHPWLFWIYCWTCCTQIPLTTWDYTRLLPHSW